MGSVIFGDKNAAFVTCFPTSTTVAQLRPNCMSERTTGFEGKLFKVVIQNWLYHPIPEERICAGSELRKRFMKAFPRPDWLPLAPEALRSEQRSQTEKKNDATIQNP